MADNFMNDLDIKLRDILGEEQYLAFKKEQENYVDPTPEGETNPLKMTDRKRRELTRARIHAECFGELKS